MRVYLKNRKDYFLLVRSSADANLPLPTGGSSAGAGGKHGDDKDPAEEVTVAKFHASANAGEVFAAPIEVCYEPNLKPPLSDEGLHRKSLPHCTHSLTGSISDDVSRVVDILSSVEDIYTEGIDTTSREDLTDRLCRAQEKGISVSVPSHVSHYLNCG